MTTIAEALTRLNIVKEAVEGIDVPNELAAAEAHASVVMFLDALIEHYKGFSDDRSRLICLAALNAHTLGQVATILSPFPISGALVFEAFSTSVEYLISLHEEVSA